MDDPEVDGRVPQAVGQRAVLGRVHHDRRAGHRRGAAVDLRVVRGVLLDAGAALAAEGQARDVPGPFHAGRQVEDVLRIDGVPPAERLHADLLPEPADREAVAAAAPLVVTQVALPKVHHLAQRRHAGELPQQAFEQRRPAAAKAAQEEHAYHGPSSSRYVRITSITGGGDVMSVFVLPDPDMVAVGGLRFAALTEGEVVHRVRTALARGIGGRIATPNVDILRQASRDPVVRDDLETADLLVADGAPLVWAPAFRGRRCRKE